MIYSTNQNRQFYVNDESKNVTVEVVRKKADGTTTTTDSEAEEAYFVIKENGVIKHRSDLIKKGQLLSVQYTESAVLAESGKVVTLSLADFMTDANKFNMFAEGELPKFMGEDFIVRVEMTASMGYSDDDIYVKDAVVHISPEIDTESKFYEALKNSLDKNFSREVVKMFEFGLEGQANAYTGVTITELPDAQFEAGLSNPKAMNFRITCAPVGVVKNWIAVEEAATDDPVVTSGQKVANLEWFCMGERGDQYRMKGWPNYVRTKYLIDPAEDYCLYDIHFFYIGSNEQMQRSEKTITIACKGDNGTIESFGEVLLGVVPTVSEL